MYDEITSDSVKAMDSKTLLVVHSFLSAHFYSNEYDIDKDEFTTSKINIVEAELLRRMVK